MARRHDIVAERQAYAKIKALEKEKLRKPVPTELTPDQVYMRLCMARDCWKKRNELAPSGTPWPDVFAKHWGISLRQFSEDACRKDGSQWRHRKLVLSPCKSHC